MFKLPDLHSSPGPTPPPQAGLPLLYIALQVPRGKEADPRSPMRSWLLSHKSNQVFHLWNIFRNNFVAPLSFQLLCGHQHGSWAPFSRVASATSWSKHTWESQGPLSSARQASPSLEPEETEDSANAHFFLEDLCDGHACIDELLSTLITDAGHE